MNDSDLLEFALQIIGIAASVASLILSVVLALASNEAGGRLRLKAVVLTVLVALVGATVVGSFYLSYRQERQVRERERQVALVQREILETIANTPLTFDDLHVQLLFRSFRQVNEALFPLVDNKTVCHRLERMELNGKLAGIRFYRLCVPPTGR